MNDIQTPPSQRLRIVIGTETFAPEINGAARFTQNLAIGLARRGHEVHVICPSATGQATDTVEDGLVVHRLQSHRWYPHPTWQICFPWETKPAVDRLLDSIKPDIVHVQAHFVLGRFVIKGTKKRKLPLVATNHFMPDNVLPYLRGPKALLQFGIRWSWRDLKNLFQQADVITAPTQLAADLLVEHGFDHEIEAISCGIDLTGVGHHSDPVGDAQISTGTEAEADETTAMPEGKAAVSDGQAAASVEKAAVFDGTPAVSVEQTAVSDEKAAAPDKKAAASDKEAAASDQKTVLFVGRLAEEKHVDQIIRAIALTDPALELRAEIVGSGEQLDALERLAREEGVADRIAFLGKISDESLYEAYARCTLFCMPGTAELQSIVSLEAMASGKPVVLANAVALPHLVREGYNGYLFPPGNVGELAQRFERIARMDAATLAAMGEGSITMIAKHDIENTLKRFEEIYWSLTTR